MQREAEGLWDALNDAKNVRSPTAERLADLVERRIAHGVEPARAALSAQSAPLGSSEIGWPWLAELHADAAYLFHRVQQGSLTPEDAAAVVRKKIEAAQSTAINEGGSEPVAWKIKGFSGGYFITDDEDKAADFEPERVTPLTLAQLIGIAESVQAAPQPVSINEGGKGEGVAWLRAFITERRRLEFQSGIACARDREHQFLSG
ncbi:hypothetical protein [Cupriavidus basilensis]